jgi:RNA-directed DNA polymerase
MVEPAINAVPLPSAERALGLYDRVTDFGNLYAAYKAAAAGKHDRLATLRHDLHAEKILWRLRWDLRSGSYRHGGYNYFTVRDPKARAIAAAPFTDRIVHHALVRQIEPLFEPGFIHDSYACRVGKGTHQAALRLQHFLRSALSSGQPLYVLRADIRKFFASVDHAVLTDRLARRIHDERTMELIRIILASYNEALPIVQNVGGGGYT